MDKLDRRIIAELQFDPRQNNAKLAASLGITQHTVGKRIERLVSSGEIIFTALPYMPLFGFYISAYIGLRLRQKSMLPLIAAQLCKSPQIRYVSSCEGFADIFIGGDFRNNEDLANFIAEHVAKIEGISQINTLVEIKRIKEPSFGRFGIRNLRRNITPKREGIVNDEIDHLIILELQKDARKPLKNLASLMKMSEQTISLRIKKLIASGAIELATLVSDKVIMDSQNVFVAIKIDLPKVVEVGTYLATFPVVANAGIYSGDFQILAYLNADSPEDINNFTNKELLKIDGVNRIDWLINLNVLKRGFSWIR